MLDQIDHHAHRMPLAQQWASFCSQETFGAMAKTEKVAFILEQVSYGIRVLTCSHDSPSLCTGIFGSDTVKKGLETQ